MKYYYPFGEEVHRLVQQDRTPKKVFVLGVYASAVHARWKKGNEIICQAIAVASEPRIFWDGNKEEAKEIIGRINHSSEAVIDNRTISILPLAHPRQIGALGAHSEKWNNAHHKWENKE